MINQFSSDIMLDRLLQGIGMFGDYGPWLLAFPALWIGTIVTLWLDARVAARRRDRAYLAFVGRRMPELRRLIKERAGEARRHGR